MVKVNRQSTGSLYGPTMQISTALLILLSSLTCITSAPVEDVKNITENVDYMVRGDMRIQKVLKTRNGNPNLYMRWPKGIIPYTLGPEFSAIERDHILQAIADYHRYTCIHWIPRTNEPLYADIRKRPGDNGCWSYVGRLWDRPTEINLAAWCVAEHKGIASHELNHAVGFEHEQNRIDRDDYLTIVWQNIDPNDYSSYDKINTDAFGVTYDYHSAMHYGTDQNRPTMIAKFGTNVKLGAEYPGLSLLDFDKVRRMYKCYGATSLL